MGFQVCSFIKMYCMAEFLTALYIRNVLYFNLISRSNLIRSQQFVLNKSAFLIGNLEGIT